MELRIPKDELARALSTVQGVVQRKNTMPILANVLLEVGTTEDGKGQVTISATDLDVGMLYIFALSGLAIYGVILGAWSSNSKYSLLGGLRASAQMISYELALILSVLSVVILAGTLSPREIVLGLDRVDVVQPVPERQH